MTEHTTLDQRIRNVLAQGPMAALYFSIAISVLKQIIAQKNDREVYSMFGGLISAATVRHCVDTIDRALHPVNSDNYLVKLYISLLFVIRFLR